MNNLCILEIRLVQLIGKGRFKVDRGDRGSNDRGIEQQGYENPMASKIPKWGMPFL
jgi:hypothetical protein